MGRKGYGRTTMLNDMYRMMDESNKLRQKLSCWVEAAHLLSDLVCKRKYAKARQLATQLLDVQEWYPTGPANIVAAATGRALAGDNDNQNKVKSCKSLK